MCLLCGKKLRMGLFSPARLFSMKPEGDKKYSAYASVISTVITFVLMLIYLSKTKHPLQFDTSVRQHLRIDLGL